MITKNEQSFLTELRDKDYYITSSNQSIYRCINNFYKAVTKLRKLKLIEVSTHYNEHTDKRISVYSLTMTGLVFVKIIHGEDY